MAKYHRDFEAGFECEPNNYSLKKMTFISDKLSNLSLQSRINLLEAFINREEVKYEEICEEYDKLSELDKKKDDYWHYMKKECETVIYFLINNLNFYRKAEKKTFQLTTTQIILFAENLFIPEFDKLSSQTKSKLLSNLSGYSDSSFYSSYKHLKKQRTDKRKSTKQDKENIRIIYDILKDTGFTKILEKLNYDLQDTNDALDKKTEEIHEKMRNELEEIE